MIDLKGGDYSKSLKANKLEKNSFRFVVIFYACGSPYQRIHNSQRRPSGAD